MCEADRKRTAQARARACDDGYFSAKYHLAAPAGIRIAVRLDLLSIQSKDSLIVM
jgi:hypothetical protein